MNKRDEAVLEEFEKRYWIYLVAHYPEKEKGLFGDMKRFFLQKLQEERERIAGEVEKCKNIIDGHGHENYNDPSMCIPCYGREIDEHENNGIDRAISIIKSK